LAIFECRWNDATLEVIGGNVKAGNLDMHECSRAYVTAGMMIRTLIGLLLLACTILGQDKSLQSVYKLNFLVTERDASRTLSERKYSFSVVDHSTGKIHAGLRLPYIPSENHLNMAMIGVIIECKVRSAEPNVNVECSAESTSIAAKQPVAPAGYPPVLNTMQAQFSGMLPLGTPAVLTTLDDPITNHHLEFQLSIAKL
jgi:hypothetical protein